MWGGVTKLKHASVQINLTLPERTELLCSSLLCSGGCLCQCGLKEWGQYRAIIRHSVCLWSVHKVTENAGQHLHLSSRGDIDADCILTDVGGKKN